VDIGAVGVVKGRRQEEEGKRQRAEGRRKKERAAAHVSGDCNFFSATVSIASLKRRQSAREIETLARTQNYRHILPIFPIFLISSTHPPFHPSSLIPHPSSFPLRFSKRHAAQKNLKPIALWLIQHLPSRALFFDLSLIEEQHSVCHFSRKLHFVRDNNHRHAFFG
jgi:hypothetical protein